MSQQIRRALEQLSENIDRNLPRIKAKLRNAGISVDNPLLHTAAKYYAALNKLADN